MLQVNVPEAKTHLSKLIKQVMEGKQVIIAKGNKPVVKLTLIDDKKPDRKLGSAKSTLKIMPDFDTPPGDFKDYSE